MKKLLFLTLALSALGCSDRDEAWDPSDLLPDSGMHDTGPDVRTDFSCQDYLLQSDFYNCGTCNNKCNDRLTDQCFNGSCSCGEQGPCAEGQRCWKGACYDPDPGEVCDTDNDCPSYRKNCVEGRCKTLNCGEFEAACPDQHICIQDQCTAVECVPEVCDGIDNDCDGEVDATNGQPLAEFCYSGPDISDINPPCQKGIRICENAQWSECMNEIPPVPEQGLLGCDGFDNDCDGCVDGVLENNMCISAEPKGFDVLFAIDLSGSMGSYIEAVKMATDTFASTYTNNPNFRFGIVGIPYTSTEKYSGGVATTIPPLMHDFSDFQTFKAALATVETVSASEEPQWDVVYELATGEIPMSWNPGSTRIIIVYTDEKGQSYRADNGKSPVDEQIMCSALTKGEVLVTVTHNELFEDFDECGFTFALSKESVVITEQLRTIITDPCSL